MGVRCNRGFVTDYIKNITISSKDAKRYGINNFCTYDTNRDGYIDISEFLAGGINDTKVFSAFASLAGDNYSENFGDKYFNDNKDLANLMDYLA